MKKIVSLALAAMLVIACFAGCASSGSTTEESAAPASESAAASAAPAESAAAGAVIKLGGIGPVTGAAAVYGTAAKNGAQIAVDEINALGGAITFDFNFQDDEHDAEKSVNAYNSLKDWGMQVLVGCVTTTPCVAVAAESNVDRIFQLTPSASSATVTEGKDNVYQMCFTDPNQGIASATYIADKQLGSKIAVIYNNSDAYSTGIYEKFAAEAQSKGLELVYTGTFTDDTATDFSVQLTAAQDAGADLIFLPIYYTPASLILAQAKSMGYAPKFFSCDGLDGILTMEGFDTTLAEGVMMLTPFAADATDEKTASFVKKYQEAYGEVPNQFAADGYDCVYAIYEACQKAGVTADMSAQDICEKLIATFSSADFAFDGLTGQGMQWSATGEVSKSPMAVVIENGAYVGMK